jgi:hypothetical protein
MAPLCYAQAYLADRLLRVLPGSMWVVTALGAAYVGVVIWILAGGGGTRTPAKGPEGPDTPPGLP